MSQSKKCDSQALLSDFDSPLSVSAPKLQNTPPEDKPTHKSSCTNLSVAQKPSTPPTHPRRALDLFSGTGSVTRTLKSLGWEVISLDWSPRSQATIQEDIMQWDYTTYPPGYFDLIAAGVPCEEYSIAKTTAPRNLQHAEEVVQRTLQIISFFARSCGGWKILEVGF